MAQNDDTGERSNPPILPNVPVLDLPSWSDDEDDDALELAEIWPAFLGEPVDTGYEPPERTVREEAAALAGTVLVRRADALVEWIEDGRAVMEDRALPLDATTDLMGLLGIEPPEDEVVTSMWEVPEISILWAALVGAGFVELGATGAAITERVGMEWGGPGSPDLYRVEAAATLFSAALQVYLTVNDDGETPAHVPGLTVLALTKAALPGGVAVAPAGDENDLWAPLVEADLEILAATGVLTVEGGRYHLVPELLPVLDDVMHQVIEEMGEHGEDEWHGSHEGHGHEGHGHA